MNSPNSPRALDIKVFVPARDLNVSLDYYQALGWHCNWQEGGLAEIELAYTRLYLQDYYAKEWAENFMVYIDVDDADAWYQHIKRVVSSGNYPGIRVNPTG